MIIAKMKEPLEDELLFFSAFYGLLNLLTKEFSHKESKNLLGLEKSATDIHKIILYQKSLLVIPYSCGSNSTEKLPSFTIPIWSDIYTQSVR